MNESRLVLSVFPGIDLLGRGFELEGFCVVRGPDPIFGGDVRDFHPPAGVFHGVIGGPPCQAFSQLRHMVEANGYASRFGNLVPEFERIIDEAEPLWFVMEEVKDAPVPIVHGYTTHSQLVRDAWVGGETRRLRRISFGSTTGARLHIETLALHREDVAAAALGGSGRATPVALGASGKRKSTAGGSYRSLSELLEVQGFPGDWLDGCPFTETGKRQAVGNGVPLPMSRAIARAVRAAVSPCDARVHQRDSR